MPIKYIVQTWSEGNPIFKESVAGNNAYIQLGIDTHGTDLKCYSSAASTTMLWDESAACLTFSGTSVKFIDVANTTTGATGRTTAQIAVTSTQSHTSGYEYALFCSITRSGDGAAGGQSTVIGADIYPSMTTASYLRCFEGYIGTIANKTVDGAIGFAVYMEDVGTACGYATCAMLHRVVTNKATMDSFINFRNHGATPANSLFEITGGAISDYLFDVFSLTAPFAAGGSGDITFADAWIKVPIKVAGSTYYLVASATPS